MKRYKEYMDGVVPSDTLKKKLEGLEPPKKTGRGKWYGIAAAVVAVTVLLAGTPPGLFKTPDDPITVNPGVAETADPKPTGEYDVFSDPNVLWGSGEDIESDMYYAWFYGSGVHYTCSLRQLMESAADSNLIAFRIVGSRLSMDDFVLNIAELKSVTELDGDGTLTVLLNAYKSASDAAGRAQAYEDISDYFRGLTGDRQVEYTGPDELRADYYSGFHHQYALERERAQIILDYANALLREWWGPYDSSAMTEEDDLAYTELFYKAEKEAESLVLEDPRYQEVSALLAEYDRNRDLVEAFWDSWGFQTVKYTRDRMEQWGFAPVYSLEEVYDGRYRVSQVYAFVGTLEQLYALKQLLGEEEGLLLGVVDGSDIYVPY